MNNKFQFKKALELIKNSKKIFLTTHEGTDGDDLGSLLGVRAFLKQLGKQTTAAVKGGVPSNLSFLPGSADVDAEFSKLDADLVIIFGCNKIDRTGWKALQTIKLPIINFDHHPDNLNFGTVNIVDPATAAVAELVYYFLEYAEAQI